VQRGAAVAGGGRCLVAGGITADDSAHDPLLIGATQQRREVKRLDVLISDFTNLAEVLCAASLLGAAGAGAGAARCGRRGCASVVLQPLVILVLWAAARGECAAAATGAGRRGVGERRVGGAA
jgi:hypothetical protein